MVGLARSGKEGSAKERLLLALSDLLADRDTLDFSLSEVAKRAGLNHGLVNYYFGGKEGLLRALLEHAASTALGSLERLVCANLDGMTKIELHIRGVLSVYHRYPYINRLINGLQGGSDENARQLSAIFILPLRRHQAALLAQAEREGAIRPTDPNLFYFSVIGACDFLFQSRRTLPHVLGADRVSEELKNDYADHLVRLVMEGLRPR